MAQSVNMVLIQLPFNLMNGGCTFCVFLQRHLNGTDTFFSLEDLLQLLSSQSENSLQVTGTLAFILAGKHLPSPLNKDSSYTWRTVV